MPPAPPKRKRSNVKHCFAFRKSGHCEKGDECKFKHTLPAEREKTPSSTSSSPPKKTRSEIDGQGSLTKNENGNEKQQQQQQKQKKGTKKIPSASEVPSNDENSKEDADQDDSKESSHITNQPFDSLEISPDIKRALSEVLKYKHMTKVQSETLPHILEGKDCLAKAKTGTGKTLAFLIPSIENIMEQRKTNASRPPISTLILSPTRELALQIEKEAKMLLHFMPFLRTVCIVGGTKMSRDVNNLGAGPIAFLVATPGRLLDHIDNTTGMKDKMRGVQSVILDEADNLLDMGFKPSIDKIFNCLPTKDQRKTLLFSATVPASVQKMASAVLRPGFVVVDTVGEEASQQTHEHVRQEVVTVPMSDVIPAVVSVLQQQIDKGGNYKIIVFFNTARLTGYMAALLKVLQCPVLDIHSRKSQSMRMKTSEQFRDAKRAILFSSDVSARGMDYPDVTFVLQVGLTDKEQYTHRLGRTARAGKGGAGMLLLMDFESAHMKKLLSGMSLETVPPQGLNIDKYRDVCEVGIHRLILDREGRKAAEQAYSAWLGFYNGNKKNCGNWTNSQLVEAANLFSVVLGFKVGEPPYLEKKTVGKMGLKGVPGLRIVNSFNKR